ncbi:MAG: hypothetical protein ACN6PR_27765, partial [Achromobacter sp.]
GFATITQTALSRFAGESVDVAQSMYTTGWNSAVASGGVVGGILLNRAGVASFAWVVIGILAVSLLGIVFAMNRALTTKICTLPAQQSDCTSSAQAGADRGRLL